MDKQVSILGCGWLGFPLARRLVQEGYRVKGSTTTPEKLPELEAAGVEALELKIDPEKAPTEAQKAFFDADTLIVTLPPGSRNPGYESRYPAQMAWIRNAVRAVGKIRKVMMVSSTSVYAPSESEVFEENLTHEDEAGNKVIFRAEKIWLECTDKLEILVLRCGGLMGDGRIPGKYFAGRKGLTNGKVPVNFIHQTDVIEVISTFLTRKTAHQVFNLVAPKHPLREELYLRTAEQFGFEPPEFATTDQVPPHKVVSPKRLTLDFGYEFRYPDPLLFDYD